MGDLLNHQANGNGTGVAVAIMRVELAGTGASAFGDFLVVR
jgi:hypothetical protein